RHTRFSRDWSSDVCSSDLVAVVDDLGRRAASRRDCAHVRRTQRRITQLNDPTQRRTRRAQHPFCSGNDDRDARQAGHPCRRAVQCSRKRRFHLGRHLVRRGRHERALRTFDRAGPLRDRVAERVRQQVDATLRLDVRLLQTSLRTTAPLLVHDPHETEQDQEDPKREQISVSAETHSLFDSRFRDAPSWAAPGRTITRTAGSTNRTRRDCPLSQSPAFPHLPAMTASGRALLIALCLALSACSPLYVIQAGIEEAKILSRRRPIAEVISDPATSSETRRKLQLVEQARTFAGHVLDLDVGDSYTTYSWVDSDTLLLVVTASEKDRF